MHHVRLDSLVVSPLATLFLAFCAVLIRHWGDHVLHDGHSSGLSIHSHSYSSGLFSHLECVCAPLVMLLHRLCLTPRPHVALTWRLDAHLGRSVQEGARSYYDDTALDSVQYHCRASKSHSQVVEIWKNLPRQVNFWLVQCRVCWCTFAIDCSLSCEMQLTTTTIIFIAAIITFIWFVYQKLLLHLVLLYTCHCCGYLLHRRCYFMGQQCKCHPHLRHLDDKSYISYL